MVQHSQLLSTLLVRRFMSTGPAAKFNRAAFPTSATATAVSRLTIRTPFASTLRPNLTGGAIPRTAGGYTLGGSTCRRSTILLSYTCSSSSGCEQCFSSRPRLLALRPKSSVRWDELPRERRDIVISPTSKRRLASSCQSLPRNAPGAFIDFAVNPTVTALSPLAAVVPFRLRPWRSHHLNLNTEGMLDVLSVDFARALKDLAATMNDLKRLSSLGDLPISLEKKSILTCPFSRL